MDNEELRQKDSDWLVDKIQVWHFFDDAIASRNDNEVKWLDPNIYSKLYGLTKQVWLEKKYKLFDI